MSVESTTPRRIVRVAHRGASALYPENTLLAYRRAVEQGVDALEVDVQRTADDALVIMHDETLDRTTNGAGRVRQHRLAEVRRLDAGQGERVPTLGEVIQLARSAGVRLCVEIKGDGETEELAIAEAVVAALERADFLDRVIVTSFSPAALLRSKALQPRLALMLDPSPQDGSLTPRQICEQTLAAGANCLSYDFHFLTQAVVDECRLSGLALWPWAPDEAGDIRRVLKLDVPGVMTNRPDVLNEVLRDASL